MWADLMVIPRDTFYIVDNTVVPIYDITSPCGTHVYKFRRLVCTKKTSPSIVALYTCASLKSKVCVKSTLTSERREVEDVVTLNAKMHGNEPCIVPAVVAFRARTDLTCEHPSMFNAILMPFFETCLNSHVHLDTSQKLDCVIQITSHCARLYKLGFCYMDLKLPNVVMYESAKKFMLIDYGSLGANGSLTGQSTFPPPCFPSGVNVLCDERYVVYGVGVLLVALLRADLFDTSGFKYEPNHTVEAKLAARDRIVAAGANAVRGIGNVFMRSLVQDALTCSVTLAEFKRRLEKYAAYVKKADSC